jgi:hypothetical protein
MDRVTPSPTSPTTPGRPDEANVFRVECAGLSGWVVYLVGHPTTYRFLSQDLAVRYAQNIAQKSRPSVVIVIDADRILVSALEFPLAVGEVTQRCAAKVP